MAERLGLPLRQFVALMGAHPVARWWRDVQPPYMEQFYSNPPHALDNSYFRCLSLCMLIDRKFLSQLGSIREQIHSNLPLCVDNISAADLAIRWLSLLPACLCLQCFDCWCLIRSAAVDQAPYIWQTYLTRSRVQKVNVYVVGLRPVQPILWDVQATSLCRDMTSGKLPKDGYLLGDMELRGIIEAFAEDNAIFQAVRVPSFASPFTAA